MGNRIKKGSMFLSVVLIAFLVISPAFLRAGLAERPREVEKGKYGDMDIITVWQIDSWEGGTNSRPGWLIARAREFEKANKGIFIEVRSLTPAQALIYLNAGNVSMLPDILSFGPGLITRPQDLLEPLPSVSGVRLVLTRSGMQDGVSYAMPWAMGGYGILAGTGEEGVAELLSSLKRYTSHTAKHTRYALTAGIGAYSSPLVALCMADTAHSLFGAMQMLHPRTGLSTFSAAWTECAAGDAALLAGSQRDIYRTVAGKLSGKRFVPFQAPYTDMVQYVGLRKGITGTRKQACLDYITTLVSPASQAQLKQLGLFPVLNTAGEVYEGDMERLGAALRGRIVVCPAFVSQEEMKAANTAAMGYLKGDALAQKRLSEFVQLCVK